MDGHFGWVCDIGMYDLGYWMKKDYTDEMYT